MQKNQKKKQKNNKKKPIAQQLELKQEPEPDLELEESFENNLFSNLL
jgi:hypothetical protein